MPATERAPDVGTRSDRRASKPLAMVRPRFYDAIRSGKCMLRLLTRSIRRKAARSLAALYFACVIAPTLLLAFACPAAAHSHDNGHAPAAFHAHAGDARHDLNHHAGGAPSDQQGSDIVQDKPAGCCGVLCLSAIANVHAPDLAASTSDAESFVPADTAREGRAPDARHRPPILLASL